MPEFDNIQTYLGFDFGLKRIGVAIGETLNCQARPLTILKAKDGEPNWQEMRKLIDTWTPAGLIVGLPCHMDGTSAPITELTRQFIGKLRTKYAIPIFEADERLTTASAKARIAQNDISRKSDQPIDDISAQIILSDWLRSNHS